MEKINPKDELQKLAEILKEDFDKDPKERRYPQKALPALHDDRVQQAIAKKIENGLNVNAVVEFGYNPFTKMSYTLFLTGKDKERVLTNGVLAIINDTCRVVGLDEDFDFPEPGSTIRLPIERNTVGQPFVLQQPSVAEQLLHVGEPLRNYRSPDGLVGYTPHPDDIGGDIPFPFPFGSPEIDRGRIPSRGIYGDNETDCSSETCRQTLIGRSCKQVTGLLVPNCDSWGNDYQEDCQTDTEKDDCGEDSMFGVGLNFKW